MSQGPRKLDLTLRVADRLIRLSTVISDYDKEGAEMTARRFNRWVKHTRDLLDGNIEKQKVDQFDRLPKPGHDADTPEKINECSKEHADFLREVVREIDEG